MNERWRPPLYPYEAKTDRERSIARLVESLGNYPQRELTHEFVYQMVERAYGVGLRDGRDSGQKEIIEWAKRTGT